MKKLLCIMALAIVSCFMLTGCNSPTFVDKDSNLMLGQSKKSIGYTLGKGTYMAYAYNVSEGKNKEATDKAAELFKLLKEQGAGAVIDEDAASGLSAVNRLAIVLCRESVKEKYGIMGEMAVDLAMEQAGHLFEQAVLNRADINMDDADDIINGFIQGVEDTAKAFPVEAPVELTEEEKIEQAKREFCPEGNCKMEGLESSDKLKFHAEVTDKLLLFAVPNYPEGADTSYQKNLQELKDRLAGMKKEGWKTTRVRVSAYDIQNDKLVYLKIVYLNLDNTFIETDCVNCVWADKDF